MASADVYGAVQEFLAKVFGDPAVAAQVASDPQGALAAYGITDFEGLDFRAAVGETYGDYELPYGNKQALQEYATGGQEVAYPQVKPPPAYSGGYQAPGDAVAHVQYATYAAYENDPQVTQEIVNTQQLLFFDNSSVDNSVSIDNSTVVDNTTDVDVDVAGDFNGEVDVDVENTTAVGEGAVANTGDGNQIATDGGEIVDVTGNEGPVLLDSQIDGDGNVLGDNQGIVVGGDVEEGAVLADGDIDGQVNTGQVQGVQGSGQAQVQTGDGVQTGGDVSDSVLGEGNNVAEVDVDTSGGDAEAEADAEGGPAGIGPVSGGQGGDVNGININFGDGSPTNVNNNDSELANNAIAGNGDAENSAELNENPFQTAEAPEITPIGSGTQPAGPAAEEAAALDRQELLDRLLGDREARGPREVENIRDTLPEPPQAGLPQPPQEEPAQPAPPQDEVPAQPEPPQVGLPEIPEPPQVRLPEQPAPENPSVPDRRQELLDKLRGEREAQGPREVETLRDRVVGGDERLEEIARQRVESFESSGLETAETPEAVELPEPEQFAPEPQAEFLPPEEEFQPQPDPAGGDEVVPV